MLAKLSERTMRWVRWGVVAAWGLLIASLAFDPVSAWLTDPENLRSPFRLDPERCVLLQGACLHEEPYAMGAAIFWGTVVPASIFILLVFGHDFWRRICPLSFLSQLPRALNWQRQRQRVDSKTGKVRRELVKIGKDSWLARHHLYLQFGLFFCGLCCRILFVNSSRWTLCAFLLGAIAAAMTVGYLYGGKAWCQYFCPMAPVQEFYGEPRGLFATPAHIDRAPVTQSMCRTITPDGKEVSACVACQNPCIDIDAERTYWEKIKDPQRQWLHYAYVGILVGYFVYYYLYAGNWEYYMSGAWAHEERQLANLLSPGFYLFGQAIAIPKLAAVPLALATFTLGGYSLGRTLEKRYKANQHRQGLACDVVTIRHRMFSLSTFFAFNFFFVFAGRNFLVLLPHPLPDLFPVLIATLSGFWLYRTWQRSPGLYHQESLASRLRKQLLKLQLDVGAFLDGRSLDDLDAREVYVLAKVLPDFTREKRVLAYKGMLREALQEGYLDPADSWEGFPQARQELHISDRERDRILAELSQEHPELFAAAGRSRRAADGQSEGDDIVDAFLHLWRIHPERPSADLLALCAGRKRNGDSDLSPDEREAIQALRRARSAVK